MRPSKGQRCTILVVEDDDSLRLLLVEFLEASGFRVLEAASGSEAVREIERCGDIDLVFSDVMMPGGMDGVMLAKWLHETHPLLPVLLASGHVGDAHIGQALSGEPFLVKPYSLGTMAEKIRETLAAA